jgi:hypothetical protein
MPNRIPIPPVPYGVQATPWSLANEMDSSLRSCVGDRDIGACVRQL